MLRLGSLSLSASGRGSCLVLDGDANIPTLLVLTYCEAARVGSPLYYELRPPTGRFPSTVPIHHPPRLCMYGPPFRSAAPGGGPCLHYPEMARRLQIYLYNFCASPTRTCVSAESLITRLNILPNSSNRSFDGRECGARDVARAQLNT